LGGDHLRTEVSLAEHSTVCLSTPSATRIYRTSGPPAEMSTVLKLASGATLEYLPDHVIPHAGSSLRQSMRVEMEQGSRGIFLDAFSSGRVALDEHWRFQEFDSRTEVSLGGKLIYFNRTKIAGIAPDPSPAFPATLGRMSDYSYCASLLIVADDVPDWRPVVASLSAELDALPGALGGVSLITEAGCSARYITKSAVDLRIATLRLWNAARRQVLNLPPLDLRKY
jgi:urease accessory protein